MTNAFDSTEKTKSIFGNFQAIGPIKTNSNNKETDIFEALASVTPAAQILFIEIKRNYNSELGTCAYTLPDKAEKTNSPAYKVFSHHVSALTKVGILKRLPIKVCRELKLDTDLRNFILNPYFVKCARYTEALEVWRKLTLR